MKVFRAVSSYFYGVFIVKTTTLCHQKNSLRAFLFTGKENSGINLGRTGWKIFLGMPLLVLAGH